MLKRLSLFLLVMLFYLPGFCQVKEIIDRDIKLVSHVPEFCNIKSKSQLKHLWKEFRKDNPQYFEIVSLDTAAIPYLIDKISDTTETSVSVRCGNDLPFNLKTGDIAFQLFKNIVGFLPMYAVTGIQWDLIGCDELCNYIYLLKSNRLKFQAQLRAYFSGPKGKAWLRIMKQKLSKEEYDKAVKELQFN